METTNITFEKLISKKDSRDSFTSLDCGDKQSNLSKMSQFYDTANLSIEKSYLDESGIEVDYVVPVMPSMTLSGVNLTLDISKNLSNSAMASRESSCNVKEMESLN